MPNFFYVAIDKSGAERKGKIEAENAAVAKEQLQAQGLFTKSISQREEKKKKTKNESEVDAAHKRTSTLLSSRVKGKELTLFTRQVSTLLESGLPMLRALDIMVQMLKPGVMRNAVLDISEDVQGGSGLSDSMARYNKVFDVLYTSMVKAGEASGQIGKILARLADFREKTERLVRKILGALVYPIAVITVATGILTGIIIFVIPKFKEMFEQLGIDLPGPTRLLLSMADFMTALYFGWLPAAVVYIVGIPLALYIVWRGIRAFPPGKLLTDTVLLQIPLFGMLIRKSSLSRFCRTMGELDAAGVPVLDSLNIIKDAITNVVLRSAINDVYVGIREGEAMSSPMRRNKNFDLMTVNMVEVGEETGEIDKMLIRVANNYDEEIDVIVESMMSLLEPALIIGMGGAIGFIVISLFLPLLSIISALS